MATRGVSSLTALIFFGAIAACAPGNDDGAPGQNSALVGDSIDKGGDTGSAPGDGKIADPSLARGDRIAGTTELYGRSIKLHISDPDNMGWASIENGDPGDQVWLDKSTDGGANWEGRVGKTSIPDGGRSWRTQMWGIDGAPVNELYWGVLRACGKAGNRDEVSCTPWFRGTALSSTPTDAAATAMMMLYDASAGHHLWRGIGWWNSANVLTGLLDYENVTGSHAFHFVIDDVFNNNNRKYAGDFKNQLMDDTAWWALAWVRAYDVTHDSKYLDTARKGADYMSRFFDGTCGGGMWWANNNDYSHKERRYKNAITNELYIKLNASLHNRLPGDTTYLDRAQQGWQWFAQSGMINGNSRINDGLTDDCKNNNDTEWTYNQGVILGALVELHRATGDASLITKARAIADATIASDGLNPNGILREPCEAWGCGADGAMFKGAFIRNLGELNRYLDGRPYDYYIQKQFDAAYKSNRTTIDQYGVHWAGSFDQFDGSTQGSGLDLAVAAYGGRKTSGWW
jgi:predicted alpha-1,6-mannanase (GH76 family)